MSKTKQSEVVAKYIDKMVADTAKAKPALSAAIHNFFYIVPPGKSESPGLIAFAAELSIVEDLAKEGKARLEDLQIERILVDVVKHNILESQSDKSPKQ